MDLRIPPNDSEAEQALLSCMLFDRDAITTAYEKLRKDDFYHPANAVIFQSMSDMYASNTPVDVVTLKNHLLRAGSLEQIGGIEYISHLAGNFYTSAHVTHYADIIQQKSILRRLIKAASDIANESFDAREDVGVIIERAEKYIFDIAQNRNTQEISHLNDVLKDAVNKIEETYQSKDKVTGLETGFIDFDNYTAGLQPSDFILIAARPSMGKTAFALNIAQHVSIKKQKTVVVFSLEMSKQQLATRLLCSEARLDAQKLRTGDLRSEDFDKIVEALAPLSKARLYIDDTPSITVMEIRSKCRRLKLDKGLDLILIDYLQLMSGNRRSENRQQEISEISRSLKALAREMNAPVVALSQLSRACESRADHRPMLSDLRESGAIEQDADLVSFLYRDGYYHPETEFKNVAELIIAKQRNGPTGTINLTWLGQYTRFESATRDM